MTIIEAVREWLRGCPLLSDGMLNVDFLPPEAASCSLDVTPVQPVVRTFIDGESERQFAFVLATRTYYGGLVRQQQKIWQLAIVDQDAQALANMDMLIAHMYAGFAERYDSCMIEVQSEGGEGGGNIGMPINVTYGGNRTIGSVTNTGGTVTFTAASA